MSKVAFMEFRDSGFLIYSSVKLEATDQKKEGLDVFFK
jgi:hypothetical protein